MLKKRTSEEKFWASVDPEQPDGECWEWQGRRGSDGYGRFKVDGRDFLAHRFSLIKAQGEPPEGKPHACHACDNPPCVNPGHLWWGSHSDNMNDAYRKGRKVVPRKTHCPHGHELSGGNLYEYGGKRHCRTCRREQYRQFKERLILARYEEESE